MKRFVKNNKVVLTIFGLLVIWIIICAIQYLHNYSLNLNAYNRVISLCKQGQLSCYNFAKPFIPDTMTVFSDLMWNYSLAYIVFIAPIILVLASLWNVSRELKTEYFKNILTRMSYKKYIKKTIIKSYKNIWILPFFVAIVFLASYFISGNFNFEKSMPMYENYLLMDKKYLEVWPFFMLTYLLVIFLHSIMYINFGFMALKKNKNFLITTIISYLIYILLEVFIVIVISGFVLARIFNIHYTTNSLSLFSIWNYRGVCGLLFMVGYSIILSGISFLIVYYQYRNKEGVIIANEK